MISHKEIKMRLTPKRDKLAMRFSVDYKQRKLYIRNVFASRNKKEKRLEIICPT